MAVYPGSTVSPAIKAFANEVELRSECINNPDRWVSFATHKSSRGAAVMACRLEKRYAFSFTETDYCVEIAALWYPEQDQHQNTQHHKTQLHKTQHHKMQYHKTQENMPLWGLTVRHRDWSTHLAVLETLSPGRDSGWPEDVLKHFIPDGGDDVSSNDGFQNGFSNRTNGTAILLHKLMELSKIIKSCSDTSGQQEEQVASLGANLTRIKLLDLD